MLFSKKVYIVIFFLIASVTLKLHSYPAKSINPLINLNELLEVIEYNLQKDMMQEACFNSRKALNILGKNMEELKEVKPNYAWDEIKSLLKAIPTQLCSEKLS